MIKKTYKIIEGKVISETLDGETIIINLDNGNYYSTNITGAIIWNKIQSGYDTEFLLEYFLNNYDVSLDLAEKSILEAIDFLLKEDLILESNIDILEKEYNIINNTKKELFIVPKIEKYEDMQEMLLADPIHDVSDKDGWPNLK